MDTLHQDGEGREQSLLDLESINTENLPEGAVDDSFAREVLNESEDSAPVGQVKALPESEFNK